MTLQLYAHLREPITVSAETVAILPLGAIETHGPHLPLGTDGLIADGLIDAAAQHLDESVRALRLPLLWVGASEEHAHRAGTLSREPEALIAEIVAIAAGLHGLGLRRIVLFNGHGGNVAAASIAALKLRTQFDMLAASAHWLDFGLPPGLTPPSPARSDVHGGWMETSVMLHLAPGLVRTDIARDQPARGPATVLFPTGPVRWGWRSDDLGGSWIGMPTQATPALGAALVEHAALGLCGLLRDISTAAWSPGRDKT